MNAMTVTKPVSTLEKLQALLSNLPREYPKGYYYKEQAPLVVCGDGTTLSVQASGFHYCTPRSNYGPYTHVEVWCVKTPKNEKIEEFDYDEEGPSAYVPIEQVVEFIDNHGGMTNE